MSTQHFRLGYKLLSNFICFPAVLYRIDSTVCVKFLYKYRWEKLNTEEMRTVKPFNVFSDVQLLK